MTAEDLSADRRPQALILGCSGPELTAEERAFFTAADPLGFILFTRNCADPDQVRRLVDDLRGAVGRTDAPVMIDQEGGRVARLKPPHWRAPPPPIRFSGIALDEPQNAEAAARLNARLIADDLTALGIDVNCAPVLDVPQHDADPIIGDRAYGDTPVMVTQLAGAACEGFLDGGVLPVIKHLPGHGRALVDSHRALPVIDAEAEWLDRIDLPPFRALSHMPWGFTAHAIYTAYDADRPATVSPTVIADVIRGAIGFEGLLMSDDIAMEALSGSIGERVTAALAAGCDLAVHCNGNLAEMQAAAAASSPMADAAWQRFRRAQAMRRPPQPLDRQAALAELSRLMGVPSEMDT